MFSGFFHSFRLSKKTIGKRIEVWTFGLKGGFQPVHHMFFSLKLLCKKDIYDINYCVGTIKKIDFFLLGIIL
jgi:hypothetical protein